MATDQRYELHATRALGCVSVFDTVDGEVIAQFYEPLIYQRDPALTNARRNAELFVKALTAKPQEVNDGKQVS